MKHFKPKKQQIIKTELLLFITSTNIKNHCILQRESESNKQDLYVTQAVTYYYTINQFVH